MKRILLALFLISVIIPLAEAHPFTLDTIPSQSSNAQIGTAQIVVFYSEDLEIEFSSLKVLDGNGEQIDNKDTSYYEGEESLIVTTPPLTEGVYTVISKVLSRVDGHLVPSAFVFGVGGVMIPEGTVSNSELIFYPEAGARFPGLVGQTIVLGAVIASFLIWATQRRDFLKTELEKLESTYQSRFLSIVGIGIIAVFASNILMLVIQTLRLETSAIDALQTSFGMTWMIRMGITIALLVVWFVLEKKKTLSVKSQIPMLVISLALIGTTTMIGHGAASEQLGAVILDYIHNLVAAAWIGGIIFLAFILLPSLSVLKTEHREKISLSVIPKFSIMVTVLLGIIIITGPILMWLLESNVGTIIESTYGRLIIVKIIIAAVMIGIGGYYQFGIQRRAEKNISSKINVHKKLKRTLRIESVLGIALLGVVALLTNGTLPAGEIQSVDAVSIDYGFSTREFSESAQFTVDVFPFTSGANTINVKVTDSGGMLIPDLDTVKVKISNPGKNITPIQLEMTKIENKEYDEFEGEGTFGFSGNWLVEIEAQKSRSINEAISLDLLIKPHLQDLRIDLVEYELPIDAVPLYPIYDSGAIWISDAAQPLLWKFNITDETFESFSFEGQSSQALVMDKTQKIWFTDIAEKRIGYFDTITQQSTITELPKITPYTIDSIPVTLYVDEENNIWISIITKGVLLKYNQDTKDFQEYRLPDQQSGPFDITQDPQGLIWFTQSAVGKIGTINPQTDEIRDITLDITLASPEALVFDDTSNLWITEHAGPGIIKYNAVLEAVEKIPVLSADSLPFAMAFDKYENIWFAQHQIDSLGVYDPHNNDIIEIPIPTETSFVQFITADDNGNIWFAEPQGNKLGLVKIAEIPTTEMIQRVGDDLQIRYTEIASPLMAAGIIAASLFFVKSVKDKRRINQNLDLNVGNA